MAVVRKITSLLCPVCKAPDTVFIVKNADGSGARMVDECCCRTGQKSPEPLSPEMRCTCCNCKYTAKARAFAVKHTRQPGEKFAKDEQTFLDEPDKGLVDQPAEMKPEEGEKKKCRSRKRK